VTRPLPRVTIQYECLHWRTVPDGRWAREARFCSDECRRDWWNEERRRRRAAARSST